MLKSLPPWGKVLNKVKRMSKCAAATRERVVLGGLASSVSGRGR